VEKIQEDETRKRPSGDPDSSGKAVKLPSHLGGILGGLGGLIEKLGELAEAGERLSRSGEFQDASGKLRGVYGIHVKTGLGDQGQQELQVEPFGNIRPPPRGYPAGESPGEDVREPLVDVHQEEDHVLVLVELPGVARENVTLELAEDGSAFPPNAARPVTARKSPCPASSLRRPCTGTATTASYRFG
jgi:hypothetical protein